MQADLEIARRWVGRARDDLLDADNNLRADETPLGLVCFHCQQAAEKYLKAFLAAQGEYPPPTHDLLVLLTEVRSMSPAVDSLWDDLAALTAYAVETRYPDDWSEPSREDAEEAREAAGRVEDWLRQALVDAFG